MSSYAQTGESTATDALGMREMQAKAFAERDSQYLLIKAPPASGKSRALMFIALDKLYNQGLQEGDRRRARALDRRVVREHRADRVTASSPTGRSRSSNNLCTPGSRPGQGRRVQRLPRRRRHDRWSAPTRRCASPTTRSTRSCSTARRARDRRVPPRLRRREQPPRRAAALGDAQHRRAHRRDDRLVLPRRRRSRCCAPRTRPSSRRSPTTTTSSSTATSTCKSLGIGYHFYQGRYTDAIHEVLDPDKKTILHIPNVHSGESTKDKIERGRHDHRLASATSRARTPTTGVITRARAQRRHDRSRSPTSSTTTRRERAKIVEYLRTMEDARRHRPDHRARHGEGGLRLALLRARADGRLPRLSDRDHPDHRPRHPRQPEQDPRPVHQPDRPARRRRRGGQGRGQQHAEGDHRLAADGAGARAELQVQDQAAHRGRRRRRPASSRSRASRSPRPTGSSRSSRPTSTTSRPRSFRTSTMLKAMPGNVDPEVMNKVLIPKIIRERYPDISTRRRSRRCASTSSSTR